MTDQLSTVQTTGTQPHVESTEATTQTDQAAGIVQSSSIALRGERLEKYVFGAGAAGMLSPPPGNSAWTATSSAVTKTAESKSTLTTSEILLEKATWSERLRDRRARPVRGRSYLFGRQRRTFPGQGYASGSVPCYRWRRVND